MTLPIFDAHDSPGPSFTGLLAKLNISPDAAVRAANNMNSGPTQSAPHGTTIIAIRYADGVVMAGDRRSTMGHAIAGRDVEKVFPADNFSGVSISGTVGFALEMVKLFQTNLEHYEKVEGEQLSFEGKANQLTQMTRQNLGMAMQGFVVIPIFAGFDTKRNKGRIFSFDITGGRQEQADYYATGSGGQDARTTIKLGYKENMTRQATIQLGIEALYEAAEEDAGTGGPDVVRGIYPTVATITSSGFNRVEDDEVAENFLALIERKKEQGQRP